MIITLNVKNLDDLKQIFDQKIFNCTSFIEVLINTQSDPSLPRPDKKPIEYLDFFNSMKYIKPIKK